MKWCVVGRSLRLIVHFEVVAVDLLAWSKSEKRGAAGKGTCVFQKREKRETG
jgi:hypothetical protein